MVLTNASICSKEHLQTRSTRNPHPGQSDTITILRSPDPKKELRKIWTKRDDEYWYKRDFNPRLKWFCAEQVQLQDLGDLANLLTRLEHEPEACLVRGEIAEGRDPNRLRRNTTKYHGAKGFLDEVDRKYVCVDLDQGDFPWEVDYADPEQLEIAAIWARDIYLANKAPELKGISCVAQFSSSASFRKSENSSYQQGNNTRIKLHLWFWLEGAVCSGSLKAWLKKIGADPALCRCDLPHYTAAPRFQDNQARLLPDPLAWRTRILPGHIPFIPTSPELLDSGAWRAQLEQEEERQKAFQQNLMKEAREKGVTDYSKRTAEEYLDLACEKIQLAPKGTRHQTVYGQSYWLGRLVAGDNGLEYNSIRYQLQHVVNAVFRQERSLPTELKAILDGLDAGMQEPFFLRRQELSQQRQPLLQPVSATLRDLDALRQLLPDEFRLALARKGTTVFVAPTGSGKTTAGKEELYRLLEAAKIGTHNRVLWACATLKNRNDVVKMLKQAGIPVWMAEGHDKTNCGSLHNYLYAQSLKQGCGRRWCRDFCTLHRNRGGSCRPPTQTPDHAVVVVTTHANASAVASQADFGMLLWDEAAQLCWHQLSTESLAEAIGREEIIGDTTDALLGLMAQSYAQRVPSSALQEVVEGLEVQVDQGFREQKFDELLYQGYRPRGEAPLHWRALKALEVVISHGGKGCYIKNGQLYLPELARVPDIPTRLIMDATATPLAAQAMYGEHTWRCFDVELNEHVTHIHIKINGGSRSQALDGSWACQRTGRLYEALQTCFPDGLHVEFKQWVMELSDENRPETIYFNGTEARGSNRWRDLKVGILWDFFVPKETKEAHALLWQELLEQRGALPQEEGAELVQRLREEAKFQLEVAPMLQAGGRLRYYEATAELPKMLISIGKERRLPVMGGTFVELPWDEALFIFSGEMNHRIAGLALEKIAGQRGGLWFQELDGLTDEEIRHVLQDLPWDLTSLNSLNGSSDPVASLCYERENAIFSLKESWRARMPGSGLRVVPFRGSAEASRTAGSGVLQYLPGTGGDLRGMEERAQREGWLGWRVEDQEGAELAHVDQVIEVLEALPVGACVWKEEEIVVWVCEAVGCGQRTVRRRISELGGIHAIRGRLMEGLSPEQLEQLQEGAEASRRQVQEEREAVEKEADVCSDQPLVSAINSELLPADEFLLGEQEGWALVGHEEELRDRGEPPEASCWPLDEEGVRQIERLGEPLQRALIRAYEGLLEKGCAWWQAVALCLERLAVMGCRLSERVFWSMLWWRKGLTVGLVVPWCQDKAVLRS